MTKGQKPRGEKLGWHLKQTRYLFRSSWYDLRQDEVVLPGGKPITYTYVEHPGSVMVVPCTLGKRIILIRSYRYPLDQWCWEVPSGSIGDAKDDSLEDLAKSELREEIGGRFDSLVALGSFYNANGFASYPIHLFLALGVEIVAENQPEDTELIGEVREFDLETLKTMMAEGTLTDGESFLALVRALTVLESRGMT